jgi:hypothetical protein
MLIQEVCDCWVIGYLPSRNGITTDTVWAGNRIYRTFRTATRKNTLQITTAHNFLNHVFTATLGSGFQLWMLSSFRVPKLPSASVTSFCNSRFLALRLFLDLLVSTCSRSSYLFWQFLSYWMRLLRQPYDGYWATVLQQLSLFAS